MIQNIVKHGTTASELKGDLLTQIEKICLELGMKIEKIIFEETENPNYLAMFEGSCYTEYQYNIKTNELF